MSVTDERFAGIDWAQDSHAVCVIDAAGEPIERLVVTHTKAGIGKAVATLARHGVAGVGIERPDGPLVAGLLTAGLTVFVIPPSGVKGLRSRYGSAGNKDDSFDAYVLADVVRTDRARLRPLTPDSPQTVTLRMTVRARQDLVAVRVGLRDDTSRSADAPWPAHTRDEHQLSTNDLTPQSGVGPSPAIYPIGRKR